MRLKPINPLVSARYLSWLPYEQFYPADDKVLDQMKLCHRIPLVIIVQGI